MLNKQCLSRYPLDVPVLLVDVVTITHDKLVEGQEEDKFWKAIRDRLFMNPNEPYLIVEDLLLFRKNTRFGSKYVGLSDKLLTNYIYSDSQSRQEKRAMQGAPGEVVEPILDENWTDPNNWTENQSSQFNDSLSTK